jgi:hypothetical protein
MPKKKPKPIEEDQPSQSVSTEKQYVTLLTEIKSRIQSAQYAALRAVNKELVGLY